MKRNILLKQGILFLLFCGVFQPAFPQGAVGVGTNTPDPSAAFEVSSTSRGMLIPRMSTAQRTAITNPATGLLVFDTNTNSFWFKGGTTWVELVDSANTMIHQNGNHIYMGMEGNVGIGTTEPTSKLEVQTSAGSPGIKLTDGSAELVIQTQQEGVTIGTATNHSITLYANSEEPPAIPQLHLDTEGRVGIQTSGPTATLDIKTLPDEPAVKVTDDLKSLLVKLEGDKVTLGTTTDHPLTLYANSQTEQMTIAPDGKIGIGTPEPTSKLEVLTATGEPGIKLTDGTDVLLMQMSETKAEIKTATEKALHLNTNGGSNQLTISPEGNIGIGKVALKKLDVAGEAHISEKLGIGNINTMYPLTFAQALGEKISLNGAAGTHFGIGLASAQMRIFADQAASSIAFGLGSTNAFTELMRLTGTGFLGIGVAAPKAPLHLANVVANRKIVLWANGDNDHQYFGFGINPSMLRYQAQGDHAFFIGIDNTSSAELMRITASGRVGVGVSAPNATMEIARGSAPSGTLQVKGTTNDSQFNYGTAEDTYIRGGKANSNVIINDLGSGNVGVGTASPTQKLHVAGNVGVTGSIGANLTNPNEPLEIGGSGRAFFGDGNGATRKGLLIDGIDADGARIEAYDYGAATGMDLYLNIFGGDVGIGTNSPAQKLHVHGGAAITGNVGIGTNTPAHKLHVEGGAAITGQLGIGNLEPHAPLHFTNGNQNRKIILNEFQNNDHEFSGFGVTGSGIRYQTGNIEFDHVFYAATSSTTSNELMRISGLGNVAIGVPFPTEKLDIGGNIKVSGNINVNGNVKAGYEVRTTVYTISEFSTQTKTCDCSPGKNVLGGGWYGPNGLATIESRPQTNGTGWVVTVVNSTPVDLELKVYAVCARIAN